MRVYIPATFGQLENLVSAHEFPVRSGTAFASTPALREAYAVGNDDELAHIAFQEATRASLRLLAVEDVEADRESAEIEYAEIVEDSGSGENPVDPVDPEDSEDDEGESGSSPGSPVELQSHLEGVLVDDGDSPGSLLPSDRVRKTLMRRVVISADIADTDLMLRPDLDSAVVRLKRPLVHETAVVAIHMDLPEAEHAVARASAAVDAADLGDEDAEFIVGDAEDHDLAWYDPTEIRFLVELS